MTSENNLTNIFETERKDGLNSIYINEKINPILIKKYKTYLDWIELVYFDAFDQMKNHTTLNVYKKDDIVKSLKTEKKEEIDVIDFIEEKCKDVTDEEIASLEKELHFEYKYKDAITIPSKTSITAIVHKDEEQIRATQINEEDFLEPLKIEEDSFEEEKQEDKKLILEDVFPLPKFLINQEEEKVTPAKRGTIVHLCMKNLDFSRQYDLEDVKLLIRDLVNKEIITEKEADSVNAYQIWQFTKSNIWKELSQAKEVHKEEPFYINIPAKDVIDNITADENILAQGIMDLYYINKNDELILLDYKTDFVKTGEESILIERHKPQLMLYKEALENALDRKVDKVYIYSVVLGKEILCE